MLNGTMNEVNQAIFESAHNAVTLSIGLISILVFWLGIMKIAEKSGILNYLARLCKPFVTMIFTDIPADLLALVYILSNFSSNILCIVTADTNKGIKDMEIWLL